MDLVLMRVKQKLAEKEGFSSWAELLSNSPKRSDIEDLIDDIAYLAHDEWLKESRERL